MSKQNKPLTLALAVQALGHEKVVGILQPEKDSSNESKAFALKLAQKNLMFHPFIYLTHFDSNTIMF